MNFLKKNYVHHLAIKVMMSKTKTLLFLVLITAFSCKVQIPVTDSISPTFKFKISGDGFEHTFTQDSNFDNLILNLREGTTYTFEYSAGDAGGLKFIQLYFPTDNFNIQGAILPQWTERTVGLTKYVEWSGDEDNPTNGQILARNFRSVGNINYTIRFLVRDFGGQSGPENSVFGDLNVNSGNHPTEIITF